MTVDLVVEPIDVLRARAVEECLARLLEGRRSPWEGWLTAELGARINPTPVEVWWEPEW